ncbi:MAG: hypothetical protein AAF982_11630, partial [Pseudomonadota bacterium]
AVGSQSEALEALIRVNQTHFRNMMLSIKGNGLDPGDSLYVIEGGQEGDYIVLDGNRRISALKVMAGPDVLDGTALPTSTKNLLLRAASGFDCDDVEPLRCVCFPAREDANEWIHRRHTGEAEGEGRIQWGRTEIQRFSGDRSILDIIDFVGRNADYSDEEWKITKATIESRKSSNLGRLLESAAGRKHLGISVKKSAGGKIPLLSSDPEWALSVLKRLIEDVRDGVVDSRSHNTASEIERYFKELPFELQPARSGSSASCAFRDIDVKSQPVTLPPPTPKPKTKAPPRPRRTLAPKKISFNAPLSAQGRHLLREATLIDVNKLTISAAFVLLTLVELAVTDYVAAHGLSPRKIRDRGEAKDLTRLEKVDAVVQDILRKGLVKDRDLHGFQIGFLKETTIFRMSLVDDFAGAELLQVPTPEAVRAAWDCCIPVFEAVYGTVR